MKENMLRYCRKECKHFNIADAYIDVNVSKDEMNLYKPCFYCDYYLNYQGCMYYKRHYSNKELTFTEYLMYFFILVIVISTLIVFIRG